MSKKDEKRYALNQSPLYKLANRRRLSELLRVSTGELQKLSKHANSLYSEFSVPKKDGGLRGVENPARRLKLVQARIARWLGRIHPPDYLFCPVKGRCYVSNASHHLNQKVVRCLDIKKYFPSTTSRRVFWFFSQVLKCDRAIAGTLTALSTYRGHLPTGSPLSPIMAYYAHYDMWQKIATICNAQSCKLSVYIDDVTISGEKVPNSLLWKIKQTIHGSGLRYHKEKVYRDGYSEVTGVVIKKDVLVVPNRQRKKMYEIKQIIKKSSDPETLIKLTEKMSGIQGQINQITRRNETD